MGKSVVNSSTVGPILKGKEDYKSIGIWIRGKRKYNYKVFGIVKLDDIDIKVKELSESNDYINIFNYRDLAPGEHKYQAGYIHNQSYNLEENTLDWSNVETHKFEINEDRPLSFVFGSCRRLIRLFGINFCGTGLEGDKIFRAIKDQNELDFVLNIGDKVYYDPTLNIKQYKTLKQKRSICRRVYNFPEHRSLYQEIAGYDMCDDHDLVQNDTGRKIREKYPHRFLDGLKTYREYQHMLGPVDSIGEPLYYSFERKGAYFFVMDTRSQRDELTENPYVLDSRQVIEFENWIKDPMKKGKYKFIVSSVPLLSQDGMDSWSGFPVQQKYIIELLCGDDIEGEKLDKVVVLTGDAHCARVGVYSIYDNGKLLGNIPEILSSGLVAVNHDKGKILTRFTMLEEYNQNNDFPYTIDNTGRGGLKIVTSFSSASYPDPSKPRGLRQKLISPFKQVVDNVFIKVTEIKEDENDKSQLEIKIINQNNIILNKFLL